jgi:peptide-methionine (S)-S-oxide reductase
MSDTTAKSTIEIAVFGGGCFWCTEAVFGSLKGVRSVTPGYTGGSVPDPTYEQVSKGNTGHIEATKIEFDPTMIAYGDLLAVFFDTHDPTAMNRQGNDIGPQYRSAIFYSTDKQKAQAEAVIGTLSDSRAFDRPIVTDILPLGEFYPAEDYHREYYKRHPSAPYCQIIIVPKLEELRKNFVGLLKH